MTNEERVRKIIQAMDQARLDHEGGYPSHYRIEKGKVYRATVDHDGAPLLEIATLADFIQANEMDD